MEVSFCLGILIVPWLQWFVLYENKFSSKSQKSHIDVGPIARTTPVSRNNERWWFLKKADSADTYSMNQSTCTFL